MKWFGLVSYVNLKNSIFATMLGALTFAIELPVALAQSDLQGSAVFSSEVQVLGQPGKIVNSNAVTPFPEGPSYNFGGTDHTPGRRIEWSTTFNNAGPNTANNVSIKVVLPPNSQVLENTLNGNPNGGGAIFGRCILQPVNGLPGVLCAYGNVANAGFGSTKFQFITDPNLEPGTQLSVDSIIETDSVDTNFSNNFTGIQFDVQPYSDIVTQTFASPSPVVAGEVVNYRIVLQSNGPSTARNVLINDEISGGGEFLTVLDSHIIGADGFCYLEHIGTPSIQCGIDAFPPGRTVTIDLALLVDPAASSSVVLDDQLTVTARTNLRVTGDLFGSVVVGEEADLSIYHDTADLNPAAGSVLQYFFTVANDGPSVSRATQVTHVMPAGVRYLADSAGCSQTSPGAVTCNLGSLKPGETREYQLLAALDCTVANGSPLVFNSSVTSASSIDPDTSNNNAVLTSVAAAGAGCGTSGGSGGGSGLTASFVPSEPSVTVKGNKAIVSFGAIGGAIGYEINVTDKKGRTKTKQTTSAGAAFSGLAAGKFSAAFKAKFVDDSGAEGLTQSSSPTAFVIKKKKK